MSSAKHASQIYAKSAIETADPRELEASLLLRAAAQLHSVKDRWTENPAGLQEALLYNRRLWLIFIDAVSSDRNELPVSVRQNILNIAGFVLGEIFSLMTKPDPVHLDILIHINRKLAAGLRAQTSQLAPEARDPGDRLGDRSAA
jgi:flagellar biosynthesis activator protein FlaF